MRFLAYTIPSLILVKLRTLSPLLHSRLTQCIGTLGPADGGICGGETPVTGGDRGTRIQGEQWQRRACSTVER